MSAVIEPAAIPWWRSSVFVGALVTIGSSLLSLVAPKLMMALGLMDAGGVAMASGTIFQVISLLAGVFTAYARKKSTLQPLTLSQAAANLHPNPQLPESPK